MFVFVGCSHDRILSWQSFLQLSVHKCSILLAWLHGTWNLCGPWVKVSSLSHTNASASMFRDASLVKGPHILVSWWPLTQCKSMLTVPCIIKCLVAKSRSVCGSLGSVMCVLLSASVLTSHCKLGAGLISHLSEVRVCLECIVLCIYW